MSIAGEKEVVMDRGKENLRGGEARKRVKTMVKRWERNQSILSVQGD